VRRKWDKLLLGAISVPGNISNAADCERRPARLMTGAEAATGFSVEVFVEKDEVAPV
jgi:hypothetical protein